MKILLTADDSAVNTTHIANLFRTACDKPGPAVPQQCDLRALLGNMSEGYVLVAELVSGRFVVVEFLDNEEIAEQSFWLLIAEMQYDSEPRTIRMDDLRGRAFAVGQPQTPQSLIDLSGLSFD